MKITEAMKELKLIEKKMMRNNDSIQKYSSQSSHERTFFPTAEEQKKEIKNLLHSNYDLMQNYLSLKQKIEKTNLEVSVEMDGKSYTLSELLVLKRKLAKLMAQSYQSMNDENAKVNIQSFRFSGSETPKVERFYDEREKNEGLRKWQDFYDNIDSRLEVINATTDLVE
jgi:hypothetical protein